MPFLLHLTASLPTRAVCRSTDSPPQGRIGESRASLRRRGRSATAFSALVRPTSSTSTSYHSSPSSSSSSSLYSSTSSSSSSPPPSAPPPPPPPQNTTAKERGKTIKEQSKTTKEQRQRRRQQQQQEQAKQKAPPAKPDKLAKPPTLPPRLSALFRPSPQSQLERKRRQVYGVPPPRALDRVLLWGDAVLLFCCCCSSERIPAGCSLTLATASVLAWVGVALAKGDYSRSSAAAVRGFDPVSRRRDMARALAGSSFTWLLFVPTALAADAVLYSRGLVSAAPFLREPDAAVLHAAAVAANAAGSIVGGAGPAAAAAAGGAVGVGGGVSGVVEGAFSGPLSWGGVGPGAAPVAEVLVAALLTMVSWRGAYTGIKFFL